MLADRDITLPIGKEKQNVLDKADLAIRVQLYMWRLLKTDRLEKARVLRQLKVDEQTRFNMILEKIKLPAEFEDDDMDYVAKQMEIVPYLASRRLKRVAIFDKVSALSEDPESPRASSIARASSFARASPY